ncbi:MAG TPA: hydroxysqualene dehydroxylase HpnE [Vicinamibacteria bacterium]|nr:hydroxysqualene dehydroxylase HpnE [Vicinamibacteria bacterium]
MRVVVIGGGFAGLTAAIALQEQRHQVVLLERRGILGGRATSFRDAQSGEDVDNGTHLMLGAYRASLDLLRRAGALDLVHAQDSLRLDYVDQKGPTSLVCPPFVAPLHLLLGLLSLRLPWRTRWDALRLGLAVRFSAAPTGTLAEAFARTRQSPATRRLLWDPLATAILNETPERAAASLFWNVYREAFLSDHRASRLVFLRAGWGRLHERLAAYFVGRGGMLRRRALVQALEVEQGRVQGVRYSQSPEERGAIQQGQGAQEARLDAEAVVLAVPWSAVPGLLPEAWRGEAPFQGLAGIEASPIVSIEMWLDRVVVEPAMVGLRESEVEWVFDKGRLFGRGGPPQHLAFIVSAARRSQSQPNAQLVATAEAALGRYFPAMKDAQVLRSHVLREPAATFACTPQAERLRPGVVTPIAGLFLAGDWTDTGLPATIEGAVRSGLAAARALEQRAR